MNGIPSENSPAAEPRNKLERIRAREALILGRPPRIPPLDRQSNAEFIVESAHRLRQGVLGDVPKLPIEQVPEIVVTMLHYPELWEAISALSIVFMGKGCKLPPRIRQLAILRVLWLCGAPYAWGEHVSHGKKAGLTSEEIERVTEGSSAPGWNAFESAVLRAAEELHADAMIYDATWAVLAEQLDENQLFELTVAIGQMTNVAYFQNALRLRLSAGNTGLTAR
ncbi:MAG: carboxymuconolactone decarboxylase family protein [Rhizomicrobium sp.]